MEDLYPQFYDLKYNVSPVTIGDVQKKLNYNSAILSYTFIDSLVLLLTITKTELDIQYLDTISNLAEKIKAYRKGLIYFSSNRYGNVYKTLANQFYRKFIPKSLDDDIANLIIIPDRDIALIPFETFLIDPPDNNSWSDLNYLIRKYNISYSYSISLFDKTYPKDKNYMIEHTGLNDWLALAPVFDTKESAHITLRTRELLKQTDSLMSHEQSTRSPIINHEYISPIPGTLDEVENIFEKFDEVGKKAIVQIKNSANELYVKSDIMKKFRYIHFATHGFVNTDNPELSGILLAQDANSKEDGVLFSGEIYNLNLNADMIVLSACETGLGKIRKGEGIIGLSRALLYAGTKNIVVSLWKVSDESTSELMIDFYDNILNQNYTNGIYTTSLRYSKLNMINNTKYAHPFYWSPFILIGY
jgi:CHAT domain-containing protein